MRPMILAAVVVVLVGKATGASAAADDNQVKQFIERLDSDRFADREQASKQLLELGAPAISALKTAALSNSLERSARAVAILETHLKSGDAATKTAEKIALEELANSGQTGLARRAKKFLAAQRAPIPNGIEQWPHIRARPIRRAPNVAMQFERVRMSLEDHMARIQKQIDAGQGNVDAQKRMIVALQKHLKRIEEQGKGIERIQKR